MIKFRVGISVANYHIVEVEANNIDDACQMAVIEIDRDAECSLTGNSTVVTSCFVNDRKSQDYANYIPEIYPQHQKVI